MDLKQLALGTAQIGLRYGIANTQGQVGVVDGGAILRSASKSGIVHLDTAIDYGESEARLGTIGVSGWLVNSKLPAVPENCQDVEQWVENQVAGSLRRLGVKRLNAMLLHRPQQLLGPNGKALYCALVALKARHVVSKIGISVYSPQEIDSFCSQFNLDVVQAPLNIIDRRLANSGWIAKLHAMGVEVQVRSVFLQGLLLMNVRPAYFDRWAALWRNWQAWLDERKLSPLEACLRYVSSVEGIDRVVVGVDSEQQLVEITSIFSAPAMHAPEELSSLDIDLIDPSRWPRDRQH